MHNIQTITPCLWFDRQAEAAASFYTAIFKNSQIGRIARYGEAGRDVHHKAAGTVMTVGFELDKQSFTALNGGREFKFNEAISFQVNCDTQKEIDYYWERLSKGGDEQAQQCGWLKDMVRSFMAGGPPRSLEDDDRPGSGKVCKGHGGRAWDEETRYRSTGAVLPLIVSLGYPTHARCLLASGRCRHGISRRSVTMRLRSDPASPIFRCMAGEYRRGSRPEW